VKIVILRKFIDVSNMAKKCEQCGVEFEISEEENKFRERLFPVIAGQKYVLPEPVECRDCRRQKRFAFRNERGMTMAKCAVTGKSVISVFPLDSPFPIYSPEIWYSDKWNPLDYGLDFDFSRPFFEQFKELQSKVPHISNILVRTENCDFCNTVGDCRNCYLIYGSVNCEDCQYGNPYDSKNCIDSLVVRNSQFCYECVDSEKLYECFFCQNCNNSRNLWFCFDVENCDDCFLCVGLRHKKNCILNKQYSREEYDEKVSELKKKDYEELLTMLQNFKKTVPVKTVLGIANENVIGDGVNNSKNCKNIFYSQNCEDGMYASQLLKTNNFMDCDFGENGDFLYEISGFYADNGSYFSHWCFECNNIFYCSMCGGNTSDCFGCVSLLHKQYCILNKQYSREEYEKLVPKIIEHMTRTGEWGKFFPMNMSPFPYDKSVANDCFPLNPTESGKIDKPFRMTNSEIEFYKKYNLHFPVLHPDERYKMRINLRNPMKFFDRKCDKCGLMMKTTYLPEYAGKVYCEKCYLKEIY